MTDREKAIVMAYTGAAMLVGDKFSIYHKYIEDICGRPIYTHEIASLAEEIKEKSRADFIELCREDKVGHWIVVPGMNEQCSKCGKFFPLSYFKDRPFEISYCPNCGARMEREG